MIILRLIGLLLLALYFLVIAVAISEGPLISIQSVLLGIIGIIIVTYMLTAVAFRINLVDKPDKERHLHTGKIPLVGGLMLYLSLIYGSFVFGVDKFYTYILISLLPIIITGIFDGIDGIKLNPVIRVIAQIISCWIVILGTDIYIKGLGDLFGFGEIELAGLGIPFTIFAIVGISNSFNMIDGKDGLLGSVSVVIMTSLLFLLIINDVIYQWALILISSLLIYLAFNLNFFGQKRKIFLGDHGSIGLGFIISWSLVYLSQEVRYITPISAIWFVLLPLTDAILTFARRLRSKKSIFIADRKHFHHKLSDSGYSDKSIMMIFSCLTTVSCLVAVASIIFDTQEYLLFYGYLTLLAFMILLGFLSNDKSLEN